MVELRLGRCQLREEDSANKHATDSKSLTDTEAAKADAEANLIKWTDETKSKTTENTRVARRRLATILFRFYTLTPSPPEAVPLVRASLCAFF